MEKPLTPEEIRTFERRLRDLHATLQERLDALEEETFVPGEEGQLAQRSDLSLEEAALDPGAEVYGSEEALVYEVHDALERVAEGTYGCCEACQATIERERLELVPHARLCASCARKAEMWGAT